MAERAIDERMLKENSFHGFEIEFGRQVHHRQIFFVEVIVLAHRILIALNKIVKQLDMGGCVPLKVHGHEAGELQEARIDLAHEARIGKWHAHDAVPAKIGRAHV